MTTDLVLLAGLLFLVSYPSRALGILTPGLERLPKPALDYLQLVGPAMLAALASVDVMVIVDDAGRANFHLGIETVAVVACMAIMAWRRNLLLGLIVAVAIVAVTRATGLAGTPA